MSFFAHAEEETKHPGKPLHLFREALKQAFCQCCTFRSNSPTLFNIDEEYEITDDDDDGADDEQEVVIRAIRARAMEARLRRKNGYTTTQNLLQVLNSMNTELINNPNQISSPQTEEEEDEEKETYFSAGSCFSRCSSASGEVLSQCSYGSREVFFSPRSCSSRCSSKKVTEFFDVNERFSKTKEPCHCEGWPFGLCRKAMLLPPLPNSPSESWSWRKGPPHLVKR
ncbi:hypothetical protein MKW98_018695 [Papaver atlanticum]|uniref:Uncharacterized protein n=1 Tax=Papaver atlanticum TaxID=357466 RepID=A0AAD4T6G2_9MAGN|nr:hypothetical protein MKW98_018695 [Papaver atlanticum]